MRKSIRTISLLLSLALRMISSYRPIRAETVTLSIRVPVSYPAITGDIFTAFEAEHPGVNVKIVAAATDLSAGYTTFAPNNFAAVVNSTVHEADVLLITQGLPVEATRTGCFLDLSAQAAADSSLAVDDFIPAAWQSYQWDGGLWGLPINVDVLLGV